MHNIHKTNHFAFDAGRAEGDRFMTLKDVPLPDGMTQAELNELGLFSDLTTFSRMDISSTELRKQKEATL